jgi:hypothetical protein
MEEGHVLAYNRKSAPLACLSEVEVTCKGTELWCQDSCLVLSFLFINIS